MRRLGCKSVKRGCGTGGCGLCTVYLDGTPILSCATLAHAALERPYAPGLQAETQGFGAFLADQGAEQCGFCNNGFIMNTLALLREDPDPDEDEIREYLAGNLCRCSGYEEADCASLETSSRVEKAEGGERRMTTVNQGVRKLDAMQLVTGQPVYTEDIAPENCLVVKLLRSPHANAVVREIDTERAMRVPGMEAVFTWKDVPQNARRYTQAGQTAPEPSPLDRLVIDRHVRFAGDVVAILAGRDEACVDKAMKLVKVEYDVLEPVLDFRTALDNSVLVHPEDNWESAVSRRRGQPPQSLRARGGRTGRYRDCDIVIDRVYHTKACQQTPMETFRTFCTIDTYGRLHIVSSTQIVFHTRRIVANALHIPRSKIRVSKPRVGGGSARSRRR